MAKAPSIRFGMLIPPPMPPLEKVLGIAAKIEESGFASIVVPDHLLMYPPGFTPNALSVLSALAVTTKKVMLGTGVTDAIRYHPAVLAQAFATIDHLSGGRAFLGIGAGEAMNTKPFGLPLKKTFSRLKEAVYLIRRLWRGERITYEGSFFKLEEAFLQITPVRESIPIYVGANSPRSREFAGECCEGWMPIAETPKTYRTHLEDVKRGAEKAGRRLEDIDTALQVYTAVSSNRDEAVKAVKRFKTMLIAKRGRLEEAGYKLRFEVPDYITPWYYYDSLLIIEDKLRELEKYAEAVPDEALEDFYIVGTPEDCIGKIEEFRRAGVKHLMLINVGPRPKEVLQVYREKIIPAFSA